MVILAMVACQPAVAPTPTRPPKTPRPAFTAAVKPTQQPTLRPTRSFTQTSVPTITPSPTLPSPVSESLPDLTDDGLFFVRDCNEACEIYTPVLSADGSLLLLDVFPDGLELWDWQNNQRVEVFNKDFTSPDYAIQVLDGGVIYAGFDPLESGDVTLYYWAAGDATGQVINTLSNTDGFVVDALFSHDGKTLAVAYSFGEVFLFDSLSATFKLSFHAHNDWTTLLDFSWDGKYLLTDSFSFDPTTAVWRVSDGQKMATLNAEVYDPGGIGFFSTDGQYVAVSGLFEEGMKVFRTSDWQQIITIPVMAYGVDAISQTLLVETDAGTVRYSLRDGNPVDAFDLRGLMRLPDGRLISLVRFDNWAGVELRLLAE